VVENLNLDAFQELCALATRHVPPEKRAVISYGRNMGFVRTQSVSRKTCLVKAARTDAKADGTEGIYDKEESQKAPNC
jgi:hypothetical protein